MADDWLSRIDFGPSDTLHADDLNNYGRDIRVWKGDVNGGGHHLANVIIDNYFPGAGYPLLSPIHVIPTSTDYTAQLRLDSEAAGNPARWVFNKDATPETGSNAGSNFQLVRCNDDGSTIDAPIQINRASGVITLGAQQWAGNINGGGHTLTNVVIPSVFQDPTTTKGDLIVNNGAGLKPFPLGAAANGMVLLVDSSQPFGVRWGQSPAVPLSRQINTPTNSGLSGGGPLTSDLNLAADVKTVFGRTGNVVLQNSDLTLAGGVPNTFNVIAGPGLTGGGQLGAQGGGVNSITLTAAVQSVMNHTGAVVLNAADVVAMGGVPATRQVKPGSGMVPTSGGALSADITLSALVTSVFGGTGDVQLTGPVISSAGGVLQSQHVTCADGTLSGGGQLGTQNANGTWTGKDIILSVVPGMTVQKINVASNGSVIGTRSTVNFVPGPNANVRMGVTDTGSMINVALDATGTTGVWHNGSLVSNSYAAINLIDGSNVSMSVTPNSSANGGLGWVDIQISSTGGGGGGTSGSQTPWTSNIDGAGNYLGNVSFIGVARPADYASPVTSANARIAIQANGPEIALRAAQAMSNQVAIVEADNDNGTAKVALKAYGSQFGGTLQGTSGVAAIAGPMTFAIAGSEAARITTAKRVLIGTAVDDGNNLVQVNGNLKILPAGSGIVFPDGSLQTTAGGGGMSDPTTTKGDLIVHAAAGTTRLPAAVTNGLVLTTDSANTNGVKWAPIQITPWTGNIDGGGFSLANVSNIAVNSATNPSGDALYVFSTAQNPSLAVPPSTGQLLIQNHTNVGLEIGGYPAAPWGNWIQSRHCTVANNAYPIVLNPLGGAVGVGIVPANNFPFVVHMAPNVNLGISSVSNVVSLQAVGDTQTAYVPMEFRATQANFPICSLGIGTSNLPVRSLDVRSSMFVGNTDWASGVGTGLIISMGAASGNTYAGIQVFSAGGSGVGNLVFQTGGGSIGIGTASPAVTVDIFGVPNNSWGQMRITSTSNNAGLSFQTSASNASGALNWQFQTNYTNWGSFDLLRSANASSVPTASTMCFVAPGWMGVQSTSPRALVHIGQNATGGGRTLLCLDTSDTPTAPNWLRWTRDSDGWSTAGIGQAYEGGYGSSIIFALHPPDGVMGTALVERMRITSTGWVGIGTTSPNSQLSIIPASLPTTPNAANQITIGEPSNNGAYRLQLGYFQDSTSHYCGMIQSYHSGSGWNLYLQPMGGNIGIGTGTTAPRALLDIIGGRTYFTSNDAFGVGLYYNAAASPIWVGENSNNAFQVSNAGGGSLITIDQSGNGSWTGYLTVGPAAVGNAGDIGCARTGSPTTGAHYFGNGGGAYIYFDGTYFTISKGTAFSQGVTIAGGLSVTAGGATITGNCNITGQYQVNGTAINTTGGPTTWVPYGSGGGTRVIGGSNTNGFGVPLYLAVSLSLNAGGSGNITVAGSIAIRTASSAGGNNAMFAIVLPGQTYVVNGTGAAITDWTEWH